MSTYEPGTVAMVTALNRSTPWRAYFDGNTWRECGANAFCVDTPTSIRPLVVLDIANPAAVVEYLKVATDGFDKAAHGMDAWAGRGPIREVWAQIEAQTKIPEPEPRGSIVTDFQGRIYTKFRADGWIDANDRIVSWDEIEGPAKAGAR